MEEILADNSTAVEKKPLSFTAKLLIGATGGFGIGLSVLCAPFVLPAFRKYCLPFVPATPAQVRNVLSVLPNNSNGKLLDIGSGDGRIVIAASKKGIESHGVELNSLLVLYSKFKAYREQATAKTAFFRTDLWKFNITPYEYVVVFGVEQMMKDLETKLLDEIRPGSKLIACRFKFPNLVPSKTIGNGVDAVWIYNMETTDLNKK